MNNKGIVNNVPKHNGYKCEPKQGGLYCPSLISTRIRQNPVGISFGPETSQIWKFILVDSGWNAYRNWHSAGMPTGMPE